ncbi:hypothetical protein [Streptomyces djakartensis]|uniref:Uncharacterized protein n=1 Tax=Streptomyces djakartensis TaxID=68193 RepID=A0ABQ2ZS89_9ACTN|nr:hypothetical protein [Streptomyces djakartensis]GGY24160.1 hypothetical protein GCM10010384_33880 [Streptomyces djakartensis]
MLGVGRRLSAGGAFGYLLLVAVLAFGVSAMHTMGHPEHSSGPVTGGSPHAVAGTHQGDTAQRTADPHTATEPAASTAPSAGGPMIGMDVLSVCVAVLTGWLLRLFLSTAALRRERLPALLARTMAVVRPLAPPPRPLLVQLSVLRI